ncbi:hypothetical protein AAFF_G00104060 [Aldrovandia affinis]|uniref:Protein AKNAD1 n=1 Tax=Aldrovandia affinis TaxID=143900 RepID=A0AAD7RWT2_9TELE|nr:hypothetical protein AAFF_G00104060 [Aldrovandia affinis]
MDKLGHSTGQSGTGEATVTGDPWNGSEVMSEAEGEDSEERSEDLDRPSSVLWERVIRQSVFVDLSDDESLHFSDQHGAFNIRLSQDSAPETTFHFSENLDESDSCEDTQDEDSVSGSSLLDNSYRNQGGGAQSSEVRVPAQRPNTVEVPSEHGHEEAGDTSEEDQEDLPYDGDLRSHIHDYDAIGQSEREVDSEDEPLAMPSAVNSGSINQDAVDNRSLALTGGGEVDETRGRSVRGVQSTDLRIVGAEGDGRGPGVEGRTMPGEAAAGQGQPNSEAPRPNIRELLLQHFTQDELLNSSLYIEAETMPEISVADSMDETILSKVSCSLKRGRDTSVGLGDDSDRSQESKPMTSEGEDTQDAEKSQGKEDVTPTGSDITVSPSEESVECGRPSRRALMDDGGQIQSSLLGRTRSCNELKYGQGKVHYPHPDFSKVAPKVKIPKATAVTPVCHPPGILRAQSSPSMLGKSAASCKATVDLISKVLEDSIQPTETPYVFSDQPKQQEDPPKSTELVQHLEAEYDKLLTKYAEAENLIDQMRLGTIVQGPADLLQLQVLGNCVDQLGLPPRHAHSTHRGKVPPLRYPEDPDHSLLDSPPAQTDQRQSSEGEKMTTELMEIISQFMQKVKEFTDCLNLKSIGINEQQMVFKSLTDAQDQLERNYIAKKEEHRALEMQNYMGLARNTGEFDTERKVEGEIFRIGMRLEDIRELINRNICSQPSPPASSTHAPSLPTDPIFSPLSPPPEETAPCFAQHVQTEEGAAGSPHVPADVCQTHDPTSAQSPPQCSGHTSPSLHHSDVSLERLGFASNEEEEEEEEADPAVGTVSNGILLPSAHAMQPSPQEGTPESLQHCVRTVLLWDCGTASPCSPVPQKQALSAQAQTASQRTVSPETDSGFGSLDLAGQAPSQSQTERSSLYSEQCSTPIITSGSESEASCSAMQTATVRTASSWKQSEAFRQISRAAHRTHGSAGVNPGRTEGESHTSRQPGDCGTDSHLAPPPQTASLPTDWTHRDTAPAEAHSHICSCHNEALSALQLEVAILKQEFEESLFQLPHITKRMEYLASRCKQEKRPKTKPWAHIKAPPSSGLRHSGYRHRKETLMNTDSNLVKVEDWISSDMEPTTDSGDSWRSVRPEHLDTSPQVGEAEDRGLRPCTDGRGRLRNTQPGSTGEDCLLQASCYTPSRTDQDTPDMSSPTGKEDVETTRSKGRPFPTSTKPLQKPLLQVNYGSSYSLPAGFKALEPQSAGHHRGRSPQSDSALLPSNVYFQRPQRTLRASSRPGSTGTHRGSEGPAVVQEEDISRTLDRAIEAARSMKHRTDRMAKSLSADLAKAELQRKLRSLYPRRRRQNTDSLTGDGATSLHQPAKWAELP